MITAFIINEIFSGDVKNFFLIYMIGYLSLNIYLMYYPKVFIEYLQRNGDTIIKTNVMTSEQYYKMVWTLFVTFEILGIMFLYGIGNDVIEISLYLLFSGLVAMRLYVINDILKSIKGKN